MAKEKIKMFKNIFKKGDIILLVILIVSIVLTIVFAVRRDAQFVEIYIDGKLSYQLDINIDDQIEILDGKMTIKVQNKKVWVAHSDCREQLCVQSQAITSGGGMIVCLPNKVVVKLVSKDVEAMT
ncbi:MAG: NusG domain II-containing protein [Clostridia bacterium]